MASVRKMSLVPQELLSNLNTGTKINLLSADNNLKRAVGLDDDIRQILQRTDISARDKANMYTQTLQQFRVQLNQSSASIATPPDTSPSFPSSTTTPNVGGARLDSADLTLIAKQLTPRLRSKGAILADILNTRASNLSVDSDYRVTIDGVRYPTSNFIDLIASTVSPYLSQSQVSTFDSDLYKRFGKVLADINIPRHLVGNHVVWGKIHNTPPTPRGARFLPSTPAPTSPDARVLTRSGASRLTLNPSARWVRYGARSSKKTSR